MKQSTILFLTFVLFLALGFRVNAAPPTPSIEVVKYRLVGFTNSPIAGNVGHQAMHEACQAALNDPNARLATSKEILETPNLPPFETPNGTPVPAAWVQPVISGIIPGTPPILYDISGFSEDANSLSCRAWRTNQGNPWLGLVWVPPGAFGGGQCSFWRYAACSAPQRAD